MKISHLFISLAVLLTGVQSYAGKQYNIIPEPAQITDGKGSFTLNTDTRFYVSGDNVANVANFFNKKLKASTGMDIAVGNKKGKNTIQLLISKKVKGEEAYNLNVTPNGVIAQASTPRGLFYAMQTFMQLLPPQVESATRVSGVKWEAPAVSIQDKPRFSYRSTLIDVCRHFFPIEMLKHEIDVLSLYKINNIHLHLTEDQGWRMEIKKYPALTEVGAWRVDDTGKQYGGYYTQEELKELVKYAEERFINIIPELEIPGHELAAIAAYPWLSCRNVEISTRPTWGIEDIVMCPGKETTFKFLEDVIDEMLEIFPSPYYHIGGDECPRREWAACPLCQKKADELGLKAEENRSREAQLQSYVVNRIEKYLNSKGKTIIGWDEILEGGNLNQSAIVMSWRGDKGGITGAKAGHKVIMTPSRLGYYTDHFQGDPAVEPYEIGGYNPLEKTYNYEPVPEEVEKAGKSDMIWGPQCNTWTEYIASAAKFDYQLYPRGLAVAETGWTAKNKKNFKDFSRRLDNDASIRLKEHNVNFHVPLPEQPDGSVDMVAFTDTYSAKFQTTRPEKMVYTTDGTEPNANSTVYTKPIEFNKTTTLKIRTILPCGEMSPVRTVEYVKQNFSPALKENATEHGLTLRTTPGTYSCTEELANINFWNKPKTIKSLVEICRQAEIPKNNRNVKNYAAIAEGKINIPADGVYFFRGNYPELYIDGQLVINNNHFPCNHHFSGTRSIALKAGLHTIKAVYMSYIIDGTPAWRGDRKFYYRQGDTGEYKEITPEMLYK